MKTIRKDDSLILEPESVAKDKSLSERITHLGVREVARRAKISPSAVSRWSSGSIALSRTTVDRIIRATKE